MGSTFNQPYHPTGPNICMVQFHDADGNWLNTSVPGTDVNTVTDPKALKAWWPTGSPYGGNIMATLDADDLKTLGAMMDHRLVRVISYLTTGRGNAYINPNTDLLPAPGFPAGKDAWSFFDDPGTVTLNELSAQGKTIVLTETAQNAAITALANKAGLTPEQLTQIVNDAVKNAVVDVNVTVHDDTTPALPTPPVA